MDELQALSTHPVVDPCCVFWEGNKVRILTVCVGKMPELILSLS
jgi:hypothetical protein